MPTTKRRGAARTTRARRRERLVNPLFVKRMEDELHANGHKGDWKSWEPSELGALSEIQHHVTKLINALEGGDRARVTELSADIANAAMKTAEVHGDLRQAGAGGARRRGARGRKGAR
jgi:hypothetical protein